MRLTKETASYPVSWVLAMNLVGLLLLHFSYCCLGELILDDIIEDYAWKPVLSRRSNIPNDDLLRLEEGVVEATRRAEIGEIPENGPVDCFGLNPVLQFAVRMMFKPMSRKKIDAKFYLVTREAPSKTEFMNSVGCVFGNNFKRKRHTVVIVHGFMSSSNAFWMNDMAHALIEKFDYNVILVDWGSNNESWKYWRAVANTRVVGRLLAELLEKLIACELLQRHEIHCIGHSLGSHICSFAARTLGPIGRITGLDPAAPCFKDKGLNASDAGYVDVVHTNTAVFGRLAAIGVKDFYPNGGTLMPGCLVRDNVFLGKWNVMKQLESAVCSHGRSYEYFIDSIRGSCKFWGRIWDQTSNGSLRALNKECSPIECAPLGLDSIDYPGSGGYFVPTREEVPFCIPDPAISQTMAIWRSIKKFFTGFRRKG